MSSGLGISLFIAGLVFVVLVWVILRIFPRTQATTQTDFNSFSFPDTPIPRYPDTALRVGAALPPRTSAHPSPALRATLSHEGRGSSRSPLRP